MPTSFFQDRHPPEKRRAGCAAEMERHLTEGGVMLAFAIHLLDQGATTVEIHPDGEHGKKFDFRGCLESRGFILGAPKGSTSYGGSYERGAQRVVVNLTPGLGDVCAQVGAQRLVAECKGGVTNTRHAGQVSKLRRHLCEAVGLLMTRPANGERQVAVVPETSITIKLGKLIAPRAKEAGIEIALVHESGKVTFVEVGGGPKSLSGG